MKRLACFALIVACNGSPVDPEDGSAPPPINVAGRYELIHANGLPIPVTVDTLWHCSGDNGSGVGYVRIVSGELEFAADSSFALRKSHSKMCWPVGSGGYSWIRGTYSVSGQHITLAYDPGDHVLSEYEFLPPLSFKFRWTTVSTGLSYTLTYRKT